MGSRFHSLTEEAGESITMRSIHYIWIVTPVLGMSLALLLPVQAADPAPAPVVAAGTAPVIEIAEIAQEGGTVEEGTVVHYLFLVTNRGQADLEVKQVKPSCGCTVPRWDKVIAPGKEGVIEAEVNTAGFRGSIIKHLTVLSNDLEHPQLELDLKATVTPLVQITPGLVTLVAIDDQPVRQVFILERTGGLPMEILQVSASQPYVKTEVKPLPGTGRYELAVTLTPEIPWGRTPTPIIVRTDLKKSSNLTLTLIVDRGIVTTPPMVFFTPLPGAVSQPQQVMLTISRPKGVFHLKAASIDDPKLKAKVEAVRDGQEYRVTVSYLGGWTAGVINRTLKLTTDDPKQPELQIPVHGLVQQVAAPTPG
jgi:hypothetical protein